MISEAVASAKKEAETTEAFLRQKVKDIEAIETKSRSERAALDDKIRKLESELK